MSSPDAELVAALVARVEALERAQRDQARTIQALTEQNAALRECLGSAAREANEIMQSIMHNLFGLGNIWKLPQ